MFSCGRKGFTLIELLVVIAIIALLAAILFPVFARAKASAKQTQCLSNLHQIGGAIGLYMNDYDDIFPDAVDASDRAHPEIWDGHPDFKARIPSMPLMDEALQPYLKSKEVFHCPSDTGTQVLDNNFPTGFVTSPSMYATYKSSYLFRTEIAFKYFSQDRFQLPTNVNVLFDGAGHWHGNNRALQPSDDFNDFLSLTNGYRYNTLFGDLHAKSISYAAMQGAWSLSL